MICTWFGTFHTRINGLVSANFQHCPCSHFSHYMNAVTMILNKVKLDVEVLQKKQNG